MTSTYAQKGLRPLLVALLAFGVASPVLAQATAPAQQTEVETTRELNATITRKNLEADHIDAANEADHRAAVARYDAELGALQNERARYDEALRLRAEEVDREQDLYNQRMADWRATVEACKRGDHARCIAGQGPAQPSRY